MDYQNNQLADCNVQAKTITEPVYLREMRQNTAESRLVTEDLPNAQKEPNPRNIENLRLTSFDDKFHLLHQSVEMVLSDGVINQHEVEFLQLFALKLGFHHEIVQFITDRRDVPREQLKSAILKKKLY